MRLSVKIPPADNDGERRLNVGDGIVALVRDDQLIDSFSGNLDSFSRSARDKSSSLASSAWQPEAWIDDKGETFSKDASFSNEIVKEMFTIRGWAETPLSFYISELCDPIDGKENRFRDYIINEELKLIRYNFGNGDAADAHIDLINGATINGDGFMIFCEKDATSLFFDQDNDNWYGKCNYPLDEDDSNNGTIADVELSQNIIMVPSENTPTFIEYLDSFSGNISGCQTCSQYLLFTNSRRRLSCSQTRRILSR